MHSCPECFSACTCSGDIEDHDTGEEFAVACVHCFGEDGEDDDDMANDVSEAPEDRPAP